MEAFPPARLDVVVAAADAEISGEPSTAVAELAYDTRETAEGALFFCVPGRSVDGHDLAPQAIAAGARALVVERWLPDLDVPQARVRSVRAAMGPVSAAFFGHPARSMRSLAFTGTNGKTTCTYLAEAVFVRAGLVPGVIGTTGARVASTPVPLARTTPEAPDLHRLLARMRAAGVGAVAMEASSHALAERRLDGLRADVAVFTNLSQDHLDLHGSMESYFRAKAALFTPEHAGHGVVNVDDRWGRRLAGEAGIPLTTYALGTAADVAADALAEGPEGSTFRAKDRRFEVRLRGRFNAENALAVIVAADLLDLDPEDVAAGIASVASVPGRMEPVDGGQPFLVMVDYAHTPDSIQHVLRGARPLVAGRVIVVFGCGGDRDRAKRSPMGRAATEAADLAIITSDNPRSEDPLAIVHEIEIGARLGGGPYRIEPDRRLAIRRALEAARPGDAVIIAGKGHETTQEVGETLVPFDDRVVAREELAALGTRP